MEDRLQGRTGNKNHLLLKGFGGDLRDVLGHEEWVKWGAIGSPVH
jgi:hypothetical protein